MTQTTPAAAPARAASPRREVSDVDALAALSSAELNAVYRGGVLFDLDALDGAPRGRMLTVAGPLGHVGQRGQPVARAPVTAPAASDVR